jgi:hypothetical protein
MSGTSPAESKENLTTLAPDIVAAILDETRASARHCA